MTKSVTPWPHEPPHRLDERGAYMVTAGTYEKRHHFRSRVRLGVLHRGLLTVARDFGWHLEAWAVFSNHYHFIGRPDESQPNATSLRTMLRVMHVKTAGWVNRLDEAPGRKVWFNFRETHLTYEKSYFARLNYVHHNAVKHGLVAVARDYPWCSAGWFERVASDATVKTVYGFKTDRISVEDEFAVDGEW